MNESMLHDPRFVYAGIICVVGLVLFIGAALAYIRTVNAISAFLKLEYPAAWRYVFQDTAGLPTAPDKDGISLTISWIIGGISRLGLTDPRYLDLLWTARRWLILCAVLFMAGILALGWIARSGAAPFH